MPKEEKTMSVKAYLDLGGGKSEVRRFGLPEFLASDFLALAEKVKNVFTLGDRNFSISWQDLDGDNIVISSDGELAEAIADCLNGENQQLLRVFVTMTEGEKSQKPNVNDQGTKDKDNEEHVGVTCDACQGKVYGFRYKCMTCPDYDLCSACEAKGVHAEHRMMRMTKKNDKPNVWFKEFRGPAGHFQTHFGMSSDGPSNEWTGPQVNGGVFTGCGAGGNPGWWGGNKRGRGFGRRGRGCGWGNNGNPGAWGGHHYNHGMFGGQNKKENYCPFMPFENNTEDFEKMAKDAQEMANAAQEATKYAQQMATQHAADIMKGIWTAWSGQQGPAPDASASASASASTNTTSSNSKSSTSDEATNTSSSGEYLKNIGKSVAEILVPLGIDVEVSVENNGIRQRCSLNKDEKATNSESTNEKETSTSERMQTDESISHDVQVQTSTNEMDVNDERSEKGQSLESKNNSEQNSDVEDWTMVSKETSPASETAPKEEHGARSNQQSELYPELPKETPPHPDPKIQRALELLCGMGYQNEGQWLTNVLVMKNGDINQVLDMLHPPK